MKKILSLVTFIIFSSVSAYCQNYNPLVQNIQFNPSAPVGGFACGSTQMVQLSQGLSTPTTASQWQTNPLTISICLTGFFFEGPVSSIIGGAQSAFFNWSYDSFAPNCIIGVQNQPLPGNSTGLITAIIKVPENMLINTNLGVSINLQVPGYMSNGNNTVDDGGTIQAPGTCSCYSHLTQGGTIANNQSFYFSGDPLPFTSTNPGSGGSGGTIVYQWQELTGTIWNDIPGATNATYDAPLLSSSRSYRRKAKRDNCGTWVFSNTLLVNIIVPNAGPDAVLTCTQPTATLGTASISGQTYAWSPSLGLSSTTVAQPIANPPSTTTYTVTMSNGTGATATDVVVVFVDKTPPAFTANASPQNVCQGTSTTLSANGNASFTWEPGSLSGSPVSSTPTSATVYTVTATASNGCTATSLVSVGFNLPPSVGTTATQSTVCLGNSTTITGTGADIYTWNFGVTYTPSITVSPANTTSYAVIGTNTSTGCTALAVRTIFVISNPTVNTTASGNNVCPGTAVTLNAFGAGSYVWQPGGMTGNSVVVNPTSTTTYTVTGTHANGCTRTAVRTINVISCGSSLNVKLFIEGYYSGGEMSTVLLNQGVSTSTSISDSIRVELRSTTAPYGIVSFVNTVVDKNGMINCTFPVSGTYYIAIKHRNALETWSALPVSLSSTPITYDFTNANNKAYGNSSVNMAPNVWALYSGDISRDENIDLIDASIQETDISNFESGYKATDINGDGNVDLLDSPVVENNINNFIFSIHP